jgi:curved DNA-binding protein CbpA
MPAPLPAPSHYDVLQLRSDASPDQIRDAWRRLARQHHPDHGATAGCDTLSRINRAYAVLSNPHERAQHDLDLRASRPVSRRRSNLWAGKPLWLAGGVAGLVLGGLAGVLLHQATQPPTDPTVVSGAVQEADAPLTLVPAHQLQSWNVDRGNLLSSGHQGRN